MPGLTDPAGDDPALERLWSALPGARLVGGAVRDLLAGIPVADHDLATALPPEEVQRVLSLAGIRTVPTGIAHGTVTAVVDHRGFEITTLRRDVRTDGRHAETAWTDDWREDAARRDFTINAMSLDRSGGLHDFFGGRADLAERRVRFVGDAATRIEEDHLRILRFFRFHARFGGTHPDPDATRAIAALAPRLALLSVERVWSETRRLLAAADPVEAVRLMADLGVLERILPEGASPAALGRLVATGAPGDPILRLAALLEGDAEALARRLRLSGEEGRRLAALRNAAAPSPETGETALRRMLAATPNAVLEAACWLAEASEDRAGGPERHADWQRLRARIGAMRRPVFPLAGRDLVARGVPPGKALGERLAAVEAWWLEDGARADRAGCLAALDRLGIADPPAG